MEQEIKNKNNSGGVLPMLFFLLTILAGISIYYLQNYYFIKPEEEFDLAATFKPAINGKMNSIKSYDFSIFNSTKFNSLKEGYWHIYDEGSLTIGNTNPFEKTR